MLKLEGSWSEALPQVEVEGGSSQQDWEEIGFVEKKQHVIGKILSVSVLGVKHVWLSI